MKNILFTALFLFSLFSIISCDPENVINNNNADSDTLDYVWDATKVVKITLKNTSIVCSSTDVTINATTLTINKKGTYEITGALNDGQIVVNAEGIVRLILNNINISNSTTSPLFILQAKKTIIILPNGTVNTISDSSDDIITPDSLNAAVFSKDYLALFGEGKLVVNGKHNGGIAGNDEIVIKSGELEVNALGTGIKVNDYFRIFSGKITVNSGGDAIKVENESNSSLGFVEVETGIFFLTSLGDAISTTGDVTILDGNFTLTCGGGSTIEPSEFSTKGIKARKITISTGVFNINSSDNCLDAKKNITIENGNFNLSSGNKSITCDSLLNIKNGQIDIHDTEKGISAYNLMFEGGKIIVNSNDDCIKATLDTGLSADDGSSVDIKGGSVLLNSQKGDGIDSNGNILISGGTLVIQGSSTISDDAIKYRGSFLISGGIVFASGGSTLVPSSSSIQNSILLKFNSLISQNSLINLQDNLATTLFTFKTLKTSNNIFVSLPILTFGIPYNLFSGGSVTGSTSNGLYENGTYTPGTKISSFILNEKNTTVILN